VTPDLDLLGRTRFDLVVIGGGIHGAAVARDAARRGVRVALFEQDDFASSTSGVTSKLAHGGLRYLEHLHLGLVRESLRERERLLRNAPHLVRPLPFLLPLTANSLQPAWKLRLGLWMYDTLARGRSLPRHRRLDAYQLHEREPLLDAAQPTGGFLFHDAQMNDARVTLENCLDARAHGAEVWNDMTVTALHTEQQRVAAVTVLDARTGRTVRVACGMVVNAAGPWVADIGRLQGLTHDRQVRLSRGSHIVVSPLTRGHGLVLRAAQDGRVFFVLPWKGNSLVGTTEVEHEGSPGDVHATEEEIRYLLTELAGVFGPQAPERRDVLACFAGVRVLPYRRGRSLGETNRQAQVRMEAPGLLGIVGGKWTTHRATAEEVVDRVLDALEWEPRTCDTARAPLPGGEIPDMNDYFRIAEDVLLKKYDVDLRILRYWVGTYGTRHVELLQLLEEDPSLGDPVEPGFPFTHAEVHHAVHREWARNLRDLWWRRTYRGYAGGIDTAATGLWEAALERALSSA